MACHGLKLGRKVPCLSRLFSTTCACANIDRQARMLAKMLASDCEKKLWVKGPRTSKTAPIDLSNPRRTRVLNNMFMEQISESLMYGSASEKVAGRDFEITKIEVAGDYQQVKVYWISGESESPSELQELLKSVSGLVRNDLMYSNVWGRLPFIIFVRDMKMVSAQQTLAKLHEISQIIAKEEMNKEVMTIEDHELPEENPSSLDYEFQPMMMNTLGLPYDSIFRRIKESKLKSYPMTVPDPSHHLGNDLQVATKQSNLDRKKNIKAILREFRKEMRQSKAVDHEVRNGLLHEAEIEDDECEGVGYENDLVFDEMENSQFEDEYDEHFKKSWHGNIGDNFDDEMDTDRNESDKTDLPNSPSHHVNDAGTYVSGKANSS